MLRLIEPNFEDLIQNHIYCLTAESRSQKTIDWYAANLHTKAILQSRQPGRDKRPDIGISQGLIDELFSRIDSNQLLSGSWPDVISSYHSLLALVSIKTVTSG